MTKRVDKPFLISVVLLIVAGFIIFISASLGILAREGASFGRIALKQLVFGIGLGTIFLITTTKIPYKFWRRNALYIFLLSLILTALVFIPGIGFEHGGAQRWISVGPYSFQPAEFLKIGALIYFAAWVSSMKNKIKDSKFGLMPLLVILGLTAGILLAQPDTDTFIVLFISLVGIFIAGGGKWRDVLILGLICLIGVATLAFTRPYLMKRFTTFLNPAADAQGAGYQIQQSLIAIGTGGLTGRGFGQSIQKFHFLPEPIGDSIFAVAGEEFGFVGSSALIILFSFFALRGMKIASHISDPFGRLLVIGIVILIISQAFINIGAMLGVLPLTGIPLTFVSHGGTALMVAMGEVGIVLHLSKLQSR